MYKTRPATQRRLYAVAALGLNRPFRQLSTEFDRVRHTKVESEDHDLTNILQSVLVSSLSTVQFLILSVPDKIKGHTKAAGFLAGTSSLAYMLG